MKTFFLLTFIFISAVVTTPVVAAPEIVNQCRCTFQDATTLQSRTETFTGTAWNSTTDADSEEASDPQILCEQFCADKATSEGLDLQGASYSALEVELFEGTKPMLGIPVPGFAGFTDPVRINGTLYTNFIAEYLLAIYKWLVGASAVFAVIIMMAGGIQYMLAGGDAGVISQAKDKITNSLTGVVLLLASYLILYTVNPQLTRFDALKLSVIEGIPSESFEPTHEGSHPNALCDTVGKCQIYCTDPSLVPDKTSGMADPSDVVLITPSESLKVEHQGLELLPTTKQKLERAAEIAASRGYTLVVVSAYRSLKQQVALVCKEIEDARNAGRAPKIPSAVAWPGTSAHGSGVAVDLRLGSETGISLWNVSYSSQRTADIEDVKTLAEIMYAAGFERYVKEIWHFQTTPGACTSNQCFSYPGDDGCTCN